VLAVAEDVAVVQLTGWRREAADYMVVAQGRSKRHIRALVSALMNLVGMALGRVC
jgi:ribosomal silencing factor RsfS